MTIQVTLCISLLLHQKKGQKAKTGTRLPKNQHYNHTQPVPITSHCRSHT